MYVDMLNYLKIQAWAEPFLSKVGIFQKFMLISEKSYLSPATLLHKCSPSVEWWNWQTRMFKGHVPKGVGVQVPLRPREFHLRLIQVNEASQTLDKFKRDLAC